MKTLKNWWLQITTVLLIMLDLGFDLINPLLVALSIPSNWILIIKILYGIGVVVKSKMQLPTQNPDKLDDLAQKIATPRVPKKN